MFPIAHVWLLERLVPEPLPAHRLGCVWPDMLFNSPLSHPESHQRGAQLWDFARARIAAGALDADEFAAFVVGVLTHGSAPRGFDWYSDEAYGGQPPALRGYAFQRGRPLAEATAAACHLPAEYGLWKAHNIVEMACERPLYGADPELSDRFAGALSDDVLLDRMATPLAGFFGQPAAALSASMREFAAWWTPPTSPAEQARVYARQVGAKHGVAHPDEAALAELIVRAADLVAPDRERYLMECTEEVGNMLAECGATVALWSR